MVDTPSQEIDIFTDAAFDRSSRFAGLAFVICPCPPNDVHAHYTMKTLPQSYSFSMQALDSNHAELLAIYEALKYADRHKCTHVRLYTDSQTALNFLTTNRPVVGSENNREVFEKLRENINALPVSFTLNFIHGHTTRGDYLAKMNAHAHNASAKELLEAKRFPQSKPKDIYPCLNIKPSRIIAYRNRQIKLAHKKRAQGRERH